MLQLLLLNPFRDVASLEGVRRGSWRNKGFVEAVDVSVKHS